jgi:general secretion pathway protein G
MSGTSMAASFVSGVAGLLKSRFPSLTAADMKTQILEGVDVIPAYAGLVLSSGRLDALKSFAPPPPAFTARAASGSEIELSWQRVPAADNYQILRAAGGGAYASIALLAGTVTSFSDTGLTPGTTYNYRIVDRCNAGDTPGCSEVSAITQTAGGGGGGSGCFIATAAFGTPLAGEVVALKRFRDAVLMKSGPGRAFVAFYYRHSPPLAGFISRHGVLRFLTRMALYPVVYAVRFPLVLIFPPVGFFLLKIVKSRVVKKLRSKKGFTLLEILVVVFILSILAAYVAPKLMGRTDDAKVAEAKVQIKSFETALKLFKMDNGFYPSTEQGLQSLVEQPTAGDSPQHYRQGGYLEQSKVPLDPWDHPYVYVCPGVHGDYDLMSLGADGKEGGEGYDADITNWDLH